VDQDLLVPNANADFLQGSLLCLHLLHIVKLEEPVFVHVVTLEKGLAPEEVLDQLHYPIKVLLRQGDSAPLWGQGQFGYQVVEMVEALEDNKSWYHLQEFISRHLFESLTSG
jgi:hypothetical protein